MAYNKYIYIYIYILSLNGKIKILNIYISRAGLLTMTIPLKLTQYLNKETEYFPWSSALGALGYLGSMMSMTEAYGQYEVKQMIR